MDRMIDGKLECIREVTVSIWLPLFWKTANGVDADMHTG